MRLLGSTTAGQQHPIVGGRASIDDDANRRNTNLPQSCGEREGLVHGHRLGRRDEQKACQVRVGENVACELKPRVATLEDVAELSVSPVSPLI